MTIHRHTVVYPSGSITPIRSKSIESKNNSPNLSIDNHNNLHQQNLNLNLFSSISSPVIQTLNSLNSNHNSNTNLQSYNSINNNTNNNISSQNNGILHTTGTSPNISTANSYLSLTKIISNNNNNNTNNNEQQDQQIPSHNNSQIFTNLSRSFSNSRNGSNSASATSIFSMNNYSLVSTPEFQPTLIQSELNSLDLKLDDFALDSDDEDKNQIIEDDTLNDPSTLISSNLSPTVSNLDISTTDQNQQESQQHLQQPISLENLQQYLKNSNQCNSIKPTNYTNNESDNESIKTENNTSSTTNSNEIEFERQLLLLKQQKDELVNQIFSESSKLKISNEISNLKNNSKFQQKYVICIVGLPGTGKSTIIKHFKNFITKLTNGSLNVLSFNAGDIRRQYESNNLTPKFDFNFNNNSNINKNLKNLHEFYCFEALNNLLSNLNSNVCDVGILDATNTTKSRRLKVFQKIDEFIIDPIKNSNNIKINKIILEVKCLNKSFRRFNIENKSNNLDYFKYSDKNKAILDFMKRIENYEKIYEKVTINELKSLNVKYFSIVNAGEQIYYECGYNHDLKNNNITTTTSTTTTTTPPLSSPCNSNSSSEMATNDQPHHNCTEFNDIVLNLMYKFLLNYRVLYGLEYFVKLNAFYNDGGYKPITLKEKNLIDGTGTTNVKNQINHNINESDLISNSNSQNSSSSTMNKINNVLKKINRLNDKSDVLTSL